MDEAARAQAESVWQEAEETRAQSRALRARLRGSHHPRPGEPDPPELPAQWDHPGEPDGPERERGSEVDEP